MAKVCLETKQCLALELHKNHLIKFGKFTLKSGLISPFYIDLRQAQSYPDTLQAVADTFAEMLTDTPPEVFLAGVPEAGTPLATATGFMTKRRLLQPRKVVKAHGTKSSVEGAYEPGDKVVMIDDLITKGDSKLEAIEQIISAGLALEKFIVLVDREQGGMDTVRTAGYQIEAALSMSELLDILSSAGVIEQTVRDEIMRFIIDN